MWRSKFRGRVDIAPLYTFKYTFKWRCKVTHTQCGALMGEKKNWRCGGNGRSPNNGDFSLIFVRFPKSKNEFTLSLRNFQRALLSARAAKLKLFSKKLRAKRAPLRHPLGTLRHPATKKKRTLENFEKVWRKKSLKKNSLKKIVWKNLKLTKF